MAQPSVWRNVAALAGQMALKLVTIENKYDVGVEPRRDFVRARLCPGNSAVNCAPLTRM